MGFGGSAAAAVEREGRGQDFKSGGVFFPPFCSFDYFYEDASSGWLAGYLIFPFHVASFPSFFFAVLPVAGLAWMVEAARCILLFLGYYFSSFAAGVTLECEKPTV